MALLIKIIMTTFKEIEEDVAKVVIGRGWKLEPKQASVNFVEKFLDRLSRYVIKVGKKIK